jgi:hypothetical protein
VVFEICLAFFVVAGFPVAFLFRDCWSVVAVLAAGASREYLAFPGAVPDRLAGFAVAE